MKFNAWIADTKAAHGVTISSRSEARNRDFYLHRLVPRAVGVAGFADGARMRQIILKADQFGHASAFDKKDVLDYWKELLSDLLAAYLSTYMLGAGRENIYGKISNQIYNAIFHEP